MDKLFDLFPVELQEEVIAYRLKKVSDKPENKPNSNNKLAKSDVVYAFSRLKKLPLDTERNLKSAMAQLWNVKNATDADRAEAVEKIINLAKCFNVCTMGFLERYEQSKGAILNNNSTESKAKTD